MKKRMMLMLGLVAWMQLAWAQNTVESIRQRYNEMKERISSHTGDNQYDGATWGQYTHVETQQTLPGTGGHREDVYMYWNSREEDRIYERHDLAFATSRYNFSARQFYEEFLYDADGSLAFIYAFESMGDYGDGDINDYEFRFYLNKGRLLYAIVSYEEYGNPNNKHEFKGTQLKSEYAEVKAQMEQKAKEIRKLFNNTEVYTYPYDE
ncbi:MAG: hypothetical protein K5893_05325 [Prevotella sp.]|nr:hypothetical protein [Prevotella sp.]